MAIGDALKVLSAEVQQEWETITEQVLTSQGEERERAKFKQELLLRISRRLSDVMEQFTEELREATQESKRRTETLLSRTADLEKLKQLKDEREGLLNLTDKSIDLANEATAAINATNADWQQLIELETAVLNNPLDGAAKRRRDAFIRQKIREFRGSDRVQ